MLPQVLRRLEALQADLAAIDPAAESDAADRIAVTAVALRELLASAGVADMMGEMDGAARLAATGV
jgi:hypothetical protein